MITELLMAAQIVSAAPPLSPAVAAQIMARLDSPANFTGRFVCIDCDGPRVIVLPADPGDGPFGPFAPFPTRAPSRRESGVVQAVAIDDLRGEILRSAGKSRSCPPRPTLASAPTKPALVEQTRPH